MYYSLTSPLSLSFRIFYHSLGQRIAMYKNTLPWPTKRTLVDIAGDNCVNTRTINSGSMLIHFVKVAFFTRSFLIWLFRPSRIKFPMLMFLSRTSIREKTTLMWDQLKGVAQCHLKLSKTLKWLKQVMRLVLTYLSALLS